VATAAQNQRGTASASLDTDKLMISRKAMGLTLVLIALLIVAVTVVAVWRLIKLPPP
jgi:hypothetical protein